MTQRQYRIVAESYLTEWLGITYPPGTWRTNVTLGDASVPDTVKLTPEERAYITKPLKPVCDALIILPDEVHIVEAKVREDRGKIEQLLIYEYLFPRTEEYKPHWNKKIRKILLTPKPQGAFEEFLKKYGIEVVYYRPPWIEEYLGSLRRKERRATGFSYKF